MSGKSCSPDTANLLSLQSTVAERLSGKKSRMLIFCSSGIEIFTGYYVYSTPNSWPQMEKIFLAISVLSYRPANRSDWGP